MGNNKIYPCQILFKVYPGMPIIYTNHLGGNSVHKHKTIEFDVVGGRSTTNYIQITFDSEDDYCTGCRNVSHCQQQHSYSGLCSLGR